MLDLIEIELTRVRRMAEQTDDGFLRGVIAPGVVKSRRLLRRLDFGDEFSDAVVGDRIVQKGHRIVPEIENILSNAASLSISKYCI